MIQLIRNLWVRFGWWRNSRSADHQAFRENEDGSLTCLIPGQYRFRSSILWADGTETLQDKTVILQYDTVTYDGVQLHRDHPTDIQCPTCKEIMIPAWEMQWMTTRLVKCCETFWSFRKGCQDRPVNELLKLDLKFQVQPLPTKTTEERQE